MLSSVLLAAFSCAAAAGAADGLDQLLARAQPPVVERLVALDTHPQNFAISETDDGVIHVGNSAGVASFDGERWTLTALPNNDIVRSLHAVGNRVYVGGYNLFGVLEPDATGALVYTDYAARFAHSLAGRRFADIWAVAPGDGGVYFRGLHDLFFVDLAAGRDQHWHAPKRFGALHVGAQRTLAQFRGEGFKQRVGDEWRPYQLAAELHGPIFVLFGVKGGGYTGVNVDGQWLRFDDGGVVELKVADELGPGAGFHRGIELAGGQWALTGNGGVIAITDTKLNLQHLIQTGAGFIPDVLPSRAGGLIAVSDGLLHQVQWPARWLSVRDRPRSLRNLTDALWMADSLLVASYSGIHRSTNGSDYSVIPGFEGGVYALYALDEDRLLVANSHPLSLYSLSRGTHTQIGEPLLYPRAFIASSKVEGRVYVLTENGLRWFDRGDPARSLSAANSETQGLRPTSLVELAADRVLIGTLRQGVLELTLGAGGVTGFRPVSDGISYGQPLVGDLVLHRGEVYATTATGLFAYVDGRFERTDLGGLAALRQPNEVLSLFVHGQDLYAHGLRRLFGQADGRWRSEALGPLGSAVVAGFARNIDRRVVLLATDRVLVRGDSPSESEAAGAVALRQVLLEPASGAQRRVALTSGARYRADEIRALEFSFSATSIADLDRVRYRGRLLPIEPQFSNWSGASRYRYSDLGVRSFKLEVQAQTADGVVLSMAPFEFEIVAPWWRTWPALIAYGLVLLALLALAGRRWIAWRTALLERERARLESLVHERTEALAAANVRLDAMAHRDGLTGVANRRRLDQVLQSSYEAALQVDAAATLIMVDVDHFKSYNDHPGHQAGDELLRQLAELLQELAPAAAMVARYGGEEFALVLPGLTLAQSQPLINGIQRAVRQRLAATVSMGAAQLHVNETLKAWIARADRALYRAKSGGRDRAVVDDSGQR